MFQPTNINGRLSSADRENADFERNFGQDINLLPATLIARLIDGFRGAANRPSRPFMRSATASLHIAIFGSANPYILLNICITIPHVLQLIAGRSVRCGANSRRSNRGSRRCCAIAISSPIVSAAIVSAAIITTAIIATAIATAVITTAITAAARPAGSAAMPGACAIASPTIAAAVC
jgi:hypothetical protein